MAGMTCEKYSVKKAKQAVLKPEMIKPDWKDNLRLNTLPIEEWGEAWKTLNWKARPVNHFEPYWLLLHNRVQRLKNRIFQPTPQMPPEEVDIWRSVICFNCKTRDNTEHGYYECPRVTKIWKESCSILQKMTSPDYLTATSTCNTMGLGTHNTLAIQ
jgi:hypothetical protein